MKQRDGKLRKISKTDEEKSNYQANLPPVRKVQETKKDSKPESEATGKKSDRIKSHEYDKWDKYDAEAEELKLDLEEEKNREMVDLMNKKNLEKSKIEELFEPNLATFTDVEKEVLAKRYKETGNDFYNAGDYSEAVKEYNKSIRVLPTATTYNNRAIACKDLMFRRITSVEVYLCTFLYIPRYQDEQICEGSRWLWELP